jgi:hypothetical protein
MHEQAQYLDLASHCQQAMITSKSHTIRRILASPDIVGSRKAVKCPSTGTGFCDGNGFCASYMKAPQMQLSIVTLSTSSTGTNEL